MSTTARLVRTRGIEAPYNKDQIGSCVLHPIILVVSTHRESNGEFWRLSVKPSKNITYNVPVHKYRKL